MAQDNNNNNNNMNNNNNDDMKDSGDSKARIAVIYFPGINCEEETRQAVEDCGMDAQIVRWNEDIDLAGFDGYVIPGGWSYEDRIRAGAISSKDPIIKIIRSEARKGKPVIGICNGAQVLIEAGLVPNIKEKPEMALAPNINPLVEGFYCNTTYCKHITEKERTAFTLYLEKDQVIEVPVAHGEGFFTTRSPDLIKMLENNGQIILKYCTKDGEIKEGYPTNPNGSLANIAAVCNMEGNVLAMMPHPERAAYSYQLKDHAAKSFSDSKNYTLALLFFKSMRDYIEDNDRMDLGELEIEGDYNESEYVFGRIGLQHEKLDADDMKLRMYVKLKIPDNVAITAKNTLDNMGFEDIADLKREDYYEFIMTKRDLKKAGKELSDVDLLVNYNKHSARFEMNDEIQKNESSDYEVGVIIKDDYCRCDSLQDTLKDNFGIKGIKCIDKGVFWKFKLNSEGRDIAIRTAIRATENLLANRHYQTYELFVIEGE